MSSLTWSMADFIRPDKPSKCTWSKDAEPTSTPHTIEKLEPPKKILPNILHHVGNTPMVRLNRIPQQEGLKCEVLVKCEFFNPGGSVKDRIGYRMVIDAEKDGKLKPGSTIIEPTSGNTGIGLAMAAAVKGYRCIIVMPEKMSNEKVCALRALGAEIVRTPTAAAFDDPEGLICVAQKLMKEIPNSIILDQYRNPGNPLAHYDGTAMEIYEQTGGNVDMVVAGAGTGGTVTGLGRKIKELMPNCKLVAIDPEGSILAQPESLNKSDVTYYELEGIGYDFIPTVLDRSIVDKWMKVNDSMALPMARRLIKDEGLLCGGSSGAAMAIAVKAAKNLKEGQRCVVLLPDGIRNYMTKFASDQWMEVRNLKPLINTQNHWWWNEKLSKLDLKTPLTISADTSCAKTLSTLKEKVLEHITIMDKKSVVGVATITTIMNAFVAGKIKLSDPVKLAMEKKVFKVSPDTSLGMMSRILEVEPYVIVVKSVEGVDVVEGFVRSVDMMQYITENGKN
nr:cystathionine beta-synthase [Onthophagus taurus]